ncbi:tRNA (adenosine(37)-N6)-threonylcarbamoyltransferase complex dimerization subunit type 1 TsaB [Roseobacter sp.]|uniref:tRNA (adenosine(37)-N6)-threonylcarbamoyltransferase complex dimerization subunit type 1 TsaB n=1 Tax=Roseobacter sp. TaxID=1907202 RepID=UPI00329835CD
MTTPPAILAFDTASAHCAAAVLVGDTILCQAQEPMQKGQAERLMGLCADLMADAGLAFGDLAAVGVGIGPGNFTGIRISVSAARGLALGLAVPAIGVSSFDALRFGQTGPCAVAIDARRDQLYVQQFDVSSTDTPVMVPATSVPPHDGPLIGATGQKAAYPIAEGIARLTAQRYQTPQPRPAPLYMRPADAAPARDAPPRILP